MHYRFLFLLILLTGCATQIMQSYVGKNVQEAILDYGPPINIMDIGEEKRAYQWKTSGGGSYVGTSASTGVYTGSYGCVYTLFADKKGKQWVVTSYKEPSLSCI